MSPSPPALFPPNLYIGIGFYYLCSKNNLNGFSKHTALIIILVQA